VALFRNIGLYGHDVDSFTIPSDPRFGANQTTAGTEGNSGYWDGGSGSLRNQAPVVAGQRQRRTTEAAAEPLRACEVGSMHAHQDAGLCPGSIK
jgi:hypothetical protein